MAHSYVKYMRNVTGTGMVKTKASACMKNEILLTCDDVSFKS